MHKKQGKKGKRKKKEEEKEKKEETPLPSSSHAKTKSPSGEGDKCGGKASGWTNAKHLKAYYTTLLYSTHYKKQ
jgi:hypothetical protein